MEIAAGRTPRTVVQQEVVFLAVQSYVLRGEDRAGHGFIRVDQRLSIDGEVDRSSDVDVVERRNCQIHRHEILDILGGVGEPTSQARIVQVPVQSAEIHIPIHDQVDLAAFDRGPGSFRPIYGQKLDPVGVRGPQRVRPWIP